MITKSLRFLASVSVIGVALVATPGCADVEPTDESGGLFGADDGEGTASTEQASSATSELFFYYATTSNCQVYPNYPKAELPWTSLAWSVPQGKSVIWRYNVNETFAMVTDPERAKNGQFPWWGFAPRACLGKTIAQKNAPAGQPLPTRIKEGRSQQADGWRPVDFDMAAMPVKATLHVKNHATLRDPAHFVVGNCGKDMDVDVSQVLGQWAFVECKLVGRRGWIEVGKLKK